ncbi:hypothetical protein K2173_024380 [Erythroxylum novogranatense]|uniref:Uncharacterized protein n=1 Tax=Erythroxylum novogranatense TaxID=1862640 RepID=A0AAV8SV88_9ROSI|nr:hypothetical protein K2173_024380 [Erythroxylum novogranatense]
MLGLHNIFLVAPPSSSFQQPDQNQQHVVGQCNASSSNSQVWTNQKTSFSREDAIIDLEGNEESYATSRVCKDCGNRAKKECEHRRCRTCCRSRGLACATHVRSTWVSAARRRERQSDVGGDRDLSAGSSSGGKRPREHVAANSNSFSTSHNSSLHQDASFKQALPGQVRAPAVFRSVRVTAMNDGEVEIAYQAMVKISGHVFKGFLYDQGIAENDEVPCISPTSNE